MAKAFRDRGRAEHGFTLIEVLISALIVTLIAGAVAGGLMANARATGDQHRRTEAQALAEQDQERLKGLSAAQLDNLTQTYTTTLESYKFTVTSKAWYLSNTNGATCTTSGGASATYFKTISTVSWTNPAGVAQSLATDESVITPPAGGSILAQFHDQTTAPLSGVAVAASGPDADAANSDANGCVIFTGLPTGTYNLAFTDAGYVDPNGNASPLADTANVASTGIGTPSHGNPVEMGQAGLITASFTWPGFNASSQATNFTGTADALSWYGSGGGYSMSNFRTNNPSGVAAQLSTTTVSGANGGLFPFATLNPTSYTNNYQLWAGICRQEQPPAGIDAATVTPGSTQTNFTVQEPTLNLTTTYKPNGQGVAPVTPADVKITFQSDAGSGTSCSDKWIPATSAANAGPSSSYVYGLPFASSATSGATASSSGQTGTVTVCADYKSGNTYYRSSTPAFTDSFSSPTSQTIALTTASTTGQCP